LSGNALASALLCKAFGMTPSRRGALPRRLLMSHDIDRPDDSNTPRHKPGSIREEASALGQRVKGGAKDIAGDIADDKGLEEKGERENAAGRDRQDKNDAV
jgi:uncharacterized protein YjbJ (UPF0337 family)